MLISAGNQVSEEKNQKFNHFKLLSLFKKINFLLMKKRKKITNKILVGIVLLHQNKKLK